MIRLTASCLLAATIVLAAPFAGPSALAQERKAAQSKAPAAGLRECRTKGAGGKVLKWNCKAEQPCCYNATTNQGVCGSPIVGCF
jgi:curli biogenesis system outer membrane secretion channel CsgG